MIFNIYVYLRCTTLPYQNCYLKEGSERAGMLFDREDVKVYDSKTITSHLPNHIPAFFRPIFQFKIQKNERLIRSLVDIVCENFITNKELKVTEINMTSGLLATEVEQNIKQFKIFPFDVDYNLVVKSQQNILEIYKSRSIEWDPKDNILLKSSHLIILRDTQDLWQMDLQSFIQDIYDSLQTHGFLLSVFRYKFTEPEIAFMDFTEQSLINDTQLKERIQNFMSICDKLDLNLICNKSDSISSQSLLFKKVVNNYKIPDKNNIINISGDYQQWFELLKQRIITAKDSVNSTDNIWLVSQDSCINGILGLMNCLRLESGGECLRYIFHMDTNTDTNIDFNTKPYSDILANDLVANVVKGGKLGTYRHIKLPADYDKIESNEYHLNFGQIQDLASLQWYNSQKIPDRTESYSVNNTKIIKHKVNVYYSGLTFKDVMLATEVISIFRLS
ncbi:unnamed protein product [Medioppia subpectinata]|uniref:Fatty acid synthase pseudo-KR domain-containing protein n=1 Tax=Medioppia subpectinata TaxID=1979941 RepID=A0A7R9PUF5_9ACAR|nr:unnamed protein product [Medioppia subpectinata]CAG2101715.1 unnamed protein product [Medioppia subpectinata]